MNCQYVTFRVPVKVTTSFLDKLYPFYNENFNGFGTILFI